MEVPQEGGDENPGVTADGTGVKARSKAPSRATKRVKVVTRSGPVKTDGAEGAGAKRTGAVSPGAKSAGAESAGAMSSGAQTAGGDDFH